MWAWLHYVGMTTNAALDQGWTADDSTFGARLALVRQRMGWGNVKEAAMGVGVPVESWRSWERDGRLPRDQVAIARRISLRTGCSYDWLLDGRSISRKVDTGDGLLRRDSNTEPAGYIPATFKSAA